MNRIIHYLGRLLPLDVWTVDRLGLFAAGDSSEKHFAEAEGCSHYDHRYFTKELPAPAVHGALVPLLHEFSALCRSNGLQFLLVHGALLGWFWGRRILPWDGDIDISVDLEVLARLEHLSGGYRHPRYRLEINPNWRRRTTANASRHEHVERNRIDGRFIDRATGLFLDITGLTPTGAGLLVTKCPYIYRWREIYPLREERFEQIVVWIPARAQTLLRREYGEASLAAGDFSGYRWNALGACWQRLAVLDSCRRILGPATTSAIGDDLRIVGRYRRTVACHFAYKRLIEVADDRQAAMPFGRQPGELCDDVVFFKLCDRQGKLFWSKLYQAPAGNEQLVHECLLYHLLQDTDFPVVVPLAYDFRYGLLFPFDEELFSGVAVHRYHCAEVFPARMLPAIQAFAEYRVNHPLLGEQTIAQLCDFQSVLTSKGLRFIDFTLWPKENKGGQSNFI